MLDTRRLRERAALKLAPWLYVPHREERDEAFARLAEIAYGDRKAAWTSPAVLVDVALRNANDLGRRGQRLPRRT